MEKLSISETVHGYFLAPKQVAAKEGESGSESEDETDDDDFNFELGVQNLSSDTSEQISVDRKLLRKTTGRVSTLLFCGMFYDSISEVQSIILCERINALSNIVLVLVCVFIHACA